jgi:hypothetical protein
VKTKRVMFVAAALVGWFTAIDSAFAQTWTQPGTPANYWSAVVSSATGAKLVAVMSSSKYFCIFLKDSSSFLRVMSGK